MEPVSYSIVNGIRRDSLFTLFSAILEIYHKKKENFQRHKMWVQFSYFLSFLVLIVTSDKGICNAPICSACALVNSPHHFCARVEESKCCKEYNSAHHIPDKSLEVQKTKENKKEGELEEESKISISEVVAICFVAIILAFLIFNSTKLCKLVSKERAFKIMEPSNIEIHL